MSGLSDDPEVRREQVRRRAEALEDAFGEVAGDAALVAIAFKHLKLNALSDPDTYEQVAAVADKVKAAYELLNEEGFYATPHDAAHSRMVVVLERESIDGCVSYVAEGLASEWHDRFGSGGNSSGLSWPEYAILPALVPFFDRQDEAHIARDLVKGEKTWDGDE